MIRELHTAGRCFCVHCGGTALAWAGERDAVVILLEERGEDGC
ncbi:hypothetical protein KNP414_05761 [Paenibacillus mucilaginosus KNP414]|uniref:Uncharacterized protein n=1 Tax=Paenibacillus mucilaginosus (strain KNP414) TaxID=1036673 RepID=F8F6X9_PAEMK|nr:hypothetical protein KNP414_05761 [Paenibacillus mucilaginosus KNP414]